jgi:hypothetical protein
MKNVVFGDINLVRTSQEAHCVSATEPSRLLLRFEIFTAVTMKNVVFGNINLVRTSQEAHCVSAAEPSRLLLRFEIFAAMTMKNAVLCDVTPCLSCRNRRFGGMYYLMGVTRIGG